VGQIWFAAQLGDVALLRGQLATARRWFEQQVLCSNDGGQRLQAELAYIGIELAAGAQRDTEGVDAAAEGYEANHVDWFALFEGQAARGRAWRAIAHHRPGEAQEILRAGADDARARGIVADEVALLHDLARLGEATAVSARMEALGRESDSQLIHAHVSHALAIAARDIEGVVEVADTYERLGMLLDAAETLSAASTYATAAGDQRTATQLRNKVEELAANLEGADTPGLLRTESVVPLSDRERQIADLAAAGVRSKDIAATLFISVRTVNNHIQRIYTKLGVRSRTELRDALVAPDRGAP
jgi:DNA-binding CsgD family transcriptional regulator